MTLVFGMVPLILIKLIHTSQVQHSTNLGRSPSDNVSTTRIALYKRALSFLSCFSAGVFLATCLLDLLPSVRHNLIKVLFSMSIYTGFPVAEFVMTFGLFIILIVEQIVLSFKESHSAGTRENSDNERQSLLYKSQPDEFTGSHESENSLGGLSDDPCIQSSAQTEEVALEDENSNPRAHSPLRAMLLVCALALHSIFEGLTVGLQHKIGDVLGIFAALVLHKSILSFSLGMNLVQSRISRKSAVKSILVFSIASPMGIAIGLMINDLWNSVSSGLVHGLLQGVASGTFLYIIFFEILPKEFNNGDDRLLKIFFLLIGYSAVTGILFLSDDTKHPFCVISDDAGN
ncbi:Zinc transporter zip1 [Plakobranchus ocellatus]|uniref:Zinc transporter zip1 n=1 Tax=Plakobranchus ocellatus TaxID=259542 RepID=A0AAV4DAD5_9GAST|nr:Zinc transporter zip1 [Plakobranchus ocellatus]